jgi:hypothetical protein
LATIASHSAELAAAAVVAAVALDDVDAEAAVVACVAAVVVAAAAVVGAEPDELLSLPHAAAANESTVRTDSKPTGRRRLTLSTLSPLVRRPDAACQIIMILSRWDKICQWSHPRSS